MPGGIELVIETEAAAKDGRSGVPKPHVLLGKALLHGTQIFTLLNILGCKDKTLKVLRRW
jgi:hypothetical protein